MERQMVELKESLLHHEKTFKLLSLSKFLYLETVELNNLLQVCFSLLLNTTGELAQVKKKETDLIESEKVLRNLVDSIACDRGNVEKRVWLLENENINYKSESSKLESQIDKLKTELRGLEENWRNL